jgi:hypothetical protein
LAGSFGARAVDRGESIPRLYNLLEIERDFSAIKIRTRFWACPTCGAIGAGTVGVSQTRR